MRVAIQGTRGSFSEAAARLRGPISSWSPAARWATWRRRYGRARADAGCLAIENSLVGSVTPTYDLLHEAFGDGALHLSREILLPVHHALMGIPGGDALRSPGCCPIRWRWANAGSGWAAICPTWSW